MTDQNQPVLCTTTCYFFKSGTPNLCKAIKEEGLQEPYCYSAAYPNSTCRHNFTQDRLDTLIATQLGMDLEQYQRVKDTPDSPVFQDP
ncbi:MAG: hypothetical protein WC796_01400 [Candidatus Pacearchaeota archaeon]|jgi:hypothetical protein